MPDLAGRAPEGGIVLRDVFVLWVYGTMVLQVWKARDPLSLNGRGFGKVSGSRGGGRGTVVKSSRTCHSPFTRLRVNEVPFWTVQNVLPI